MRHAAGDDWFQPKKDLPSKSRIQPSATSGFESALSFPLSRRALSSKQLRERISAGCGSGAGHFEGEPLLCDPDLQNIAGDHLACEYRGSYGRENKLLDGTADGAGAIGGGGGMVRPKKEGFGGDFEVNITGFFVFLAA